MLNTRSFKCHQSVAQWLLFSALASCASERDEVFERDLVGHITFSPMFSAYDGVHEYIVTPSVPDAADEATNGNPVLASSLKWDFDRSFVSLGQYPDLPNAIKLTTKKAGETVVTLTARHLSGNPFRQTAALIINKANVEEWKLGDEVFRAGALAATADPDTVSSDLDCIGVDKLLSNTVACVDCHAGSDRSGALLESTPVQTAGYSNSQLIDIVTEGTKPAGGTFNSCLSAEPGVDALFHQFHRYDLSDEEKRGIIWKLRSLPPKVAAERGSVADGG